MLSDDIKRMEQELEAANAELKLLRDAIDELPNAPRGFGNQHADRVKWTARFVKENWSVRQEADAWKQRAEIAESAVAACVSASRPS